MTTVYDFDPFDTYPLNELLQVEAPPPPRDFHSFWRKAYSESLATDPKPEWHDTGKKKSHWKIIDIHYTSTNETKIGAWLLLPKKGEPKRAFIVGHGYGGRQGPDFDLPFPDAAILFPCCRGISRSAAPPISTNPNWHVLHDIDKRDKYIIRGCVQDIWLSVSTIEHLFPYLCGNIAYLGISFCGGIGALALAEETRIAKAHLNVPTFGHHRLRLKVDTYGSGKAQQHFFKEYPRIALRTLRYYDAANAAENFDMPVHFALAVKDPVVTPPGQFAIYNHVRCEKKLCVLDEGHGVYKRQKEQHRALVKELASFFQNI